MCTHRSFTSVVSLQLEHFRDTLAGLEELVLRDLSIAVEVALAETALHLVVYLVVVQRLALEEVLTLRDAGNGNYDNFAGYYIFMWDLTP